MQPVIEHFDTTTKDGWTLPARRVTVGTPNQPHPIVIVPGYGMNSFILGYHPTGTSMEAHLAKRGFEVWSVDLRGQGRSRHPKGRPDYDMADLALTDLSAILRLIDANSQVDGSSPHVIGCSLGGTIVFVNLALGKSNVRSAIALGAPLRWVDVHPLLRLAFKSPWLARRFPNKGNRKLASLVLPLALKVPKALHIYMHPEISDTSNYKKLLNTVDDTSPSLNEQIARWVRSVDLSIGGQNVSAALADCRVPLLSVVANADGIVPHDSATSAHDIWGPATKEVITVGNERVKFAHADLFISRYSGEMVFDPIADWCAARSS